MAHELEYEAIENENSFIFDVDEEYMLKVINEQYEEDNDGISSDTDFLLDDDNFLDICADEAIFRRLIKCTEESKKKFDLYLDSGIHQKI